VRIASDKCYSCGYPISDSASPPACCPECGKRTQSESDVLDRTGVARRRRRWLFAVIALLVVVALAVLLPTILVLMIELTGATL
jgi:hypothetical protein